MKYSEKIFRTIKTDYFRTDRFCLKIWLIFIWKGKNIMREKNIKICNFYILRISGLFFSFCQFFFDITFSVTCRICNIPVLTKIFYYIIIVDSIVDHRQNRTDCNGEHNENRNKKFQMPIFSTNILHKICLSVKLWWKSVFVSGSGMLEDRSFDFPQIARIYTDDCVYYF